MRILMTSTIAVLLLTQTAVISVEAATPLFSEDFEEGQRTGNEYFGFTSSSRNVYVVEDPVTGATTIPHRGQYSLGFSHRAKPPGKDSTAQQDYQLGERQNEIWYRYFFRVPENFFHRQEESSSNNKWLVAYTDDYERSGVTVVLEYWPDGNGGSRIAYRWVRDSGFSSHQGHAQFIRIPEDRGTWIEFVFHVRLASAAARNDGVIQTWIRREGESDYIPLHDRTDAPLYSSAQTGGFAQGYMMGWSNSGFAEETTFYVDDLEFSSSSLLVEPKPPGNLTSD